MNYFAHGRRFVEQPYFLAGTAVPDWLSIVDRSVRASAKLAKPLAADPDSRVADLASGIVQHHHDDRWFHGTRAFAELTLQMTVAIRDLLPRDDGFRPSFLGHVLVELLLDDILIASDPGQLDAYYRALADVDPVVVAETVARITGRETLWLADLIPRFSTERFLYDYAHDEKLLARLNRVMTRVQLPQLPPRFCQLFPEARKRVKARSAELMAGESPGDA